MSPGISKKDRKGGCKAAFFVYRQKPIHIQPVQEKYSDISVMEQS